LRLCWCKEDAGQSDRLPTGRLSHSVPRPMSRPQTVSASSTQTPGQGGSKMTIGRSALKGCTDKQLGYCVGAKITGWFRQVKVDTLTPGGVGRTPRPASSGYRESHPPLDRPTGGRAIDGIDEVCNQRRRKWRDVTIYPRLHQRFRLIIAALWCQFHVRPEEMAGPWSTLLSAVLVETPVFQ